MRAQFEPRYRWHLTTVERWRLFMWLWLALAIASLVLGEPVVAFHLITVAVVFNVGSVILERLGD